jgi:hypothetical protein
MRHTGLYVWKGKVSNSKMVVSYHQGNDAMTDSKNLFGDS